MTTTLSRERRRQLENAVREARRVAEGGAAKALEQLGVGDAKAPTHLSSAQAKLRNALRAHGRQVGDRRNGSTGEQAIGRLTSEVAYEHWHRMLFARFLAENNLLIEPDSGVAITLAECQELARERSEDWLALASRYAQTMLPQIFRTSDPVLDVQLPPETRSRLDDVLKALPHEIFIADDSLGWVYQYWQADRKAEVDLLIKSGRKAGANELSPITQLFTEDYMVWFLLHNTLGAWWAGKVLVARPELGANAATESELRAACAVADVDWLYLRFVREEGKPWRPAAGTFNEWPKAAKDITVLDPCMGSGHFLVFALPILAALRAQEEGLSPDTAIEAVLRDNLYGLELDPRCTQIAAFNLALAAWKRAGYRKLPALHLACSGLSLGVSKEEWLKLAERAAMELPVALDADLLGIRQDNLFSDAVRRGFERLYELFVRAPVLGSLIQPRVEGDLIEKGFSDLEPLLDTVLGKQNSEEVSEMAVAAQGLAKAASILAGNFTLVATNVPYLGRGKQDESLKEYCERTHPDAKADIATCFIQRCLAFCAKNGSAALVAPQNWYFLTTYSSLRRTLFTSATWNFAVKLGPAAFQDMNWWAANTALAILSGDAAESTHLMSGIDVSESRQPLVKASLLKKENISTVSQKGQLANPDSRLLLDSLPDLPLLEHYAEAYQGVSPADFPRFGRNFWEILHVDSFRFWQSTIDNTLPYGGRDLLLWWDRGLEEAVAAGSAFIRGESAWGKGGVVVRQMRHLPVTLYTGEVFDTNCAVIVPRDYADLPAIWAYCSSDEFRRDVRIIDQKTNVTNATLVKVPFDINLWRQIADQLYSGGLPRPSSNDATQWLFPGFPRGSATPLQVAVARLVGYRWPRQRGYSFPDCPAIDNDGLEAHADDIGIVPLMALKGSAGAAERVTALLQRAYGSEWSAAKLVSLLADVDAGGSSLEDWLLDKYFEQHCALFQQRPFVWHVWDGRRDGFNVLVNYHRLTAANGESKRLLERLAHTYLGDWIDVQRRDSAAGLEGADARLAAASHLKMELEKILAGEPPYDLFVRWKPLCEQAIGWDPDINTGVRLNIRPFMTARPFGARAKNGCILRTTPRIKWEKDRGKEPERSKEDFPWFWGWDEATQDFMGGNAYDGNRWNDLHYTNNAKRAARQERARSAR